MVSAQVLTEGILKWKDAQIMPIKSAQHLRGCMEHFSTTNPICEVLSAHADELLKFGDENNEWVSCPSPEIWDKFWCSMRAIETCPEVDVDWEALFHGSLFRLLPLAGRLSLKMEVRLSIWITVDATLDYLSGISWYDREFFRISTEEVVRLRGIPSDTVFEIGEREILAVAFAVFLWGIRDGVSRRIILRTDNRNVFH